MTISDFTKSQKVGSAFQTDPTPAHQGSTEDISFRDLYLQDASGSVNNEDYGYFITLNLGTSFKVMAQHYNCIKKQVIRGKFEWQELTQKEQHAYFLYKLKKIIEWLELNDKNIKYDFFFEATMRGNLHVHGRLSAPFIKSMKDLKIYFHQHFEIPVKERFFMDVKKYNGKLWNNYDIKTKKQFQSVDFPHLKKV